LAAYRAGRYQQAVDYPESGLAKLGASDRGKNLPALAMAYAKLGKQEKALATYTEATEVIEQQFLKLVGDYLGASWLNWLTGQLLLREAADVLEQSDAAAATPLAARRP
jgi:tetratricopeptide (TPR) repeat protein